VQSETSDDGAAATFVDRLLRFEKGGRFDVAVGNVLPDGRMASGSIVDPLHVNRILNALKRGGVDEVHYSGQQIFTGQPADGMPFNFTKASTNKPMVRMTLRPKDLEGELPDSANGWTWVYRDDGYWVVKESERERYGAALIAPNNVVLPTYSE